MGQLRATFTGLPIGSQQTVDGAHRTKPDAFVEQRGVEGGRRAAFRLFELLPMLPRCTVEKARQQLATRFPTANAAVKVLAEPGIVMKMTGQRKNRTFGYLNYIELLARAE